ncbi:LLM class flavin-dependent oxidoreductase [Rhizorhabdus argentea]|uniref:LLM class flavin-dependent oxidoreductase n=1 Tax=Rhizorhabdus argentea TaxID=1387174 RepID=UPI0030EE9DA0
MAELVYTAPAHTQGEARKLRFGVAYNYLDNDRATATDPSRRRYEPHWAETLDHVAWAESIGFDSVWFCEHHFDGLCPSPAVMAAAAAMRTKRVRLSSIVALAPLYHPLRLAEDAAMVSVLSQGRYDLGIGMGYSEKEFAAFGVNMRHRPSLMEDTVDFVRRAWTGEPFTFEGKRFKMPEIAVTPVPADPPRILMGGVSEPAIRRAALIGDGFLSSNNEHVRIYADALKDYGRTGTVIAAQVALIAEDPERAVAELEQYALNYVNTYVERGFVQHSRFEKIQEAVDLDIYRIWDGAKAVSEIVEAVTANPVIEEVVFVASSGPGEPIASTYPRTQYLMDYVVPEIRKRVGSSL